MVPCNSEICATLKVVGRQLEKINLCDPQLDGDFRDIAGPALAWKECVNIRDIGICNCSIEHARVIVETPRKHQENLYFMFEAGFEGTRDANETNQILDTFSLGTGGVTNFVYTGSLFSLDSFDKFMGRKKSSLRSFSFVFNEVTHKMEEFSPRYPACLGLEHVYEGGVNWNDIILKKLRSRGVTCHGHSGLPMYRE